MKTKPIDQAKRAELCRIILAGESVASVKTAAADLAALYRAAGMGTMARVIEAGGIAGAHRHAQACIGTDPR